MRSMTVLVPAVSQPSSSSAVPPPASASALASASETPQQQYSCSLSSSSPPQLSPEPIPEESDEDSESVSHIEPVTPVSGRQSPEHSAFQDLDNHIHPVIIDSSFPAFHPESTTAPETNIDLRKGPFANREFKDPFKGKTVAAQNPLDFRSTATTPRKSISTRPISPPSTARTSAEESQPTPIQGRRRSTRGSASSSFKRTMSNLFKRTTPQLDGQPPFMVVANQSSSDAPNRRWSMARSSATTRSTTPPSPGARMFDAKEQGSHLLVPGPDDFMKKSNRASTGLNLRARAVNFATGNGRNTKKGSSLRRASSFDNGNKLRYEADQMQNDDIGPRQVFYMAADVGVGVKARRLSLSLPDEILIDVAELANEFEYEHKFLGRHRGHLGKGATAKVRIMARKGFPEELYAVKEFRGKSSSETKEEYEKKVKSEFSIAKSLHHPNVVETVRLCTDHGRWNHVMEYCSEGDLFSLVKKGYLKKEDRQNDRLCLFKQLIQGLNYLHANGIAHRDIKLENLLVTKDSKLKITDFGVSEVFSGIHPGVRESGGECGRQMGQVRLCNPGVCGSEPYIAPEVLAKDRKYDPRALDVWSSAIVMICLYAGKPLWAKAKYGEAGCDGYTSLVRSYDKWNAKHADGLATITESDYPAFAIFDTFFNPPALRRVLLMMLNPNPDKRVSISELVNHRWIKNIECCQLESYDDPQVVIDATKSKSLNSKKIFCHNHLPPVIHNSHSLGKMPGQAGYY